jgi:nitrite reductase (cytochrome c-552)
MPYKRDGAVKICYLLVRSPLLNVARACLTCHRYPETEIVARAQAIQDRTQSLLKLGEQAHLDLIGEIETAQKQGVSDERLQAARDLHRRAQWRLDFVAAENSMGFHAPQESARILAEAIDFARQGQNEALRAQNGAKSEPVTNSDK